MIRAPIPNGGSDSDRSGQSRQLTYRAEDEELPTEAVVRAVATLTGTPLLDLDPLCVVVDPDHLDGIFEGASGGAIRTRLSFEYEGCAVTVLRDGVRVRTLRDDR